MTKAKLYRTATSEKRDESNAVFPAKPGKLGRRPGKNPTRDEILDAAEAAFAANGYAATPLRTIAGSAKVNQALLHHYFGTKEELFQAIFLRRGQRLAARRIELLSALEARSRPKITVTEIVRAYLSPAYELKQQGPGGIAFLQIQSRLHSEPKEITNEMRPAVYDEAMQRYIAALAKALPQLDASTIYWRMIFSVGAYLYTISDSHRIGHVSGGVCDPADLDFSFDQLASYITGGLGAPPVVTL